MGAVLCTVGQATRVRGKCGEGRRGRGGGGVGRVGAGRQAQADAAGICRHAGRRRRR